MYKSEDYYRAVAEERKAGRMKLKEVDRINRQRAREGLEPLDDTGRFLAGQKLLPGLEEEAPPPRQRQGRMF